MIEIAFSGWWLLALAMLIVALCASQWAGKANSTTEQWYWLVCAVCAGCTALGYASWT